MNQSTGSKSHATIKTALSEEEVQTESIVIDNGSFDMKVGFGGEDAPRSCFPSVLGWPRHAGVGGVMLGAKKDNHVGKEAVARRGLLALRHPITRGVVTDWEDVEKIWHHTFYCELTVAPEEHPLLMTELPSSSRAEKEKMAAMVFESFNVPALYIANMAVLSLYSTGRTTGIAVESGDGQTHVVPVWEGYSFPHNFASLPLAGQDLTRHLTTILRGEGYPFSTPKDLDHARSIKEGLCYVCSDYDAECEAAQQSQSYEREYTMPDGSQISLSQVRFQIPETMFKPHMVDLDTPGIQYLVNHSVQKCEPEIRKELYANIVLGGGNTLFPQFEARLQKEVQALAPDGSSVKLAAFPERKYAAWLGGSILASLNTFPCMWASKIEYDEFGVSIVHRKF